MDRFLIFGSVPVVESLYDSVLRVHWVLGADCSVFDTCCVPHNVASTTSQTLEGVDPTPLPEDHDPHMCAHHLQVTVHTPNPVSIVFP